ncbi:MAG: threonine synthase [Phycisphaerales bacterium]|nr:threonine synthase [Phycisphaerales bacterium]
MWWEGAGIAGQKCINPDCGREYGIREVRTGCAACGELLDVVYDWPRALFARDWSWFERGGGGGPMSASGVWQFAELMPFMGSATDIVSVGEGKTVLQRADQLGAVVGMEPGKLHLQYEGLNPTGSFKDNGMTAAFTHARMVGAKTVACASTGNTSASMAVYAAAAGMRAVVFIGEGKIALGKLSQALDYGALTLQVKGDFDACLERVRQVAEGGEGSAAERGGGVYLMNSVNPFRLEGQKAVMYRVLRDLRWEVPDWIVVPGGNLGNCSAFGKAFMELRALGMVERVPRLAVINATGASTLDRVYNGLRVRWNGGRYDKVKVKGEYERMDRAGEGGRAHTIASAIEINRPVNLSKALRALEEMSGVVRSVGDDEILEHKALVGRHGLGCEPASAATLAGLVRLLGEGVIKPGERVVCVLTGHQLKDPDATVGYHMGVDAKTGKAREGAKGKWANMPVKVENELGEILRVMREGR